MSNRTKTLILMGATGVAAGTVGVMAAPEGENKASHALLWGGPGAALAGVTGLFLFDEEARRREAESRASKLDRELSEFRMQSEPELLGSSQEGFERPLPDRLRHLVTPGKWSLYRVDRWVNAGDSELVHQDMILRFHQPQINLSGKPYGTKEEQGMGGKANE